VSKSLRCREPALSQLSQLPDDVLDRIEGELGRSFASNAVRGSWHPAEGAAGFVDGFLGEVEVIHEPSLAAFCGPISGAQS
jgi:hypothetical protein